MKLAAHIRAVDHAVQTVDEHADETAMLARYYGRQLHIEHISELSGFLHDMGKWTCEFGQYLHRVVIDGEKLTPYIDHSTAGARYLYDRYYLDHGGKQPDSLDQWAQNLVVEMVGMAILSHHSGLQDFVGEDGGSDFIRRVREKELPYYDEVVR